MVCNIFLTGVTGGRASLGNALDLGRLKVSKTSINLHFPDPRGNKERHNSTLKPSISLE